MTRANKSATVSVVMYGCYYYGIGLLSFDAMMEKPLSKRAAMVISFAGRIAKAEMPLSFSPSPVTL